MRIKAVSNPPNPFTGKSAEWLEQPPAPQLVVYEEEARSILTTNDSPDLGFTWSVNPYRGCFHSCAYCYARPTHQYLDFGAGTDFDRRIVVKKNAPALFERELRKKSWKGETVVFSGVTDCYQPLEASYELTRKCLEVALRYRNPVAIITKGVLVERDAELLAELNREAGATVMISLSFADDETARYVEPSTPLPSRRLKAMRSLSDKGVPVGLALAPVIPGLNDTQMVTLLENAAECGARSAFMTLLRLPAGAREVFIERLEAALPDRAASILERLRKLKGGSLNRTEFGTRMIGEGPQWDALHWMFRSTCDRLGISHSGDAREMVDAEQQGAPARGRRGSAQLTLFNEREG